VDPGLAAALPLALGAAVSPGLLAIVLLILSSEHRPRARAWFYLLGVATVLVVFTFVGIVTLRALIEAFGTPPTTWSIAIKAAGALVLLGLGWRYLRRPRAGPTDRRPWLVARLSAAGPPVFFVLGVATMMTNWSTLLLYLSALQVIRAASAGAAMTVLAFCVVFLLTIGPLLLPVVAVTMLGHRSDRLLALLGRFASRHADQIIAGVYCALAVLIALSALTELASR
jgi:threonine/homoserine/homoserine lactone efflux protein